MAYISEIKYGGNGEGFDDEFIEVTLFASDDPADFVLSFYDADGTLRPGTSSFFSGSEISMQDIINAVGGNPGSLPSGVGGLDLQVITHPDDPTATIFIIPSDLSRNTTNLNAEAAALTDTSSGTVVDAYDFGSGSNSATFTEGAASGATPTDTLNANASNSVQFDQTGGALVGTPDPTSSIICFGDGTQILTMGTKSVPVETLKPLDLVATEDGRYLPLRHIFKRTVSAKAMARVPNLRPVRLRKGALGGGMPSADLLVSRQHRFLVRSPIVSRMFGCEEVLVAAHQLTELEGVDVICPTGALSYWHLLLDEHAILIAEGAATESLFVGEAWIKGFDDLPISYFQDLNGGMRSATLAREVPKPSQQRKLILRHKKNGVALVSPTPAHAIDKLSA